MMEWHDDHDMPGKEEKRGSMLAKTRNRPRESNT
jgi:hypothetical protein